jgi:NADH dehydrogenase (ubiquinone) 1 beta subcomplex subunit 9
MSLATASFQTAHRLYVKSLYKRSLKLSLDWYIRRDLWRQKALEIRQQFELNKNVTSPKELQQIFAKTEKQLEEFAHPDPYKCMYNLHSLLPNRTVWHQSAHRQHQCHSSLTSLFFSASWTRRYQVGT